MGVLRPDRCEMPSGMLSCRLGPASWIDKPPWHVGSRRALGGQGETRGEVGVPDSRLPMLPVLSPWRPVCVSTLGCRGP